MKTYLHSDETKTNNKNLKIGDRVQFLGWSSTTYRLCEIVKVWTYTWGVRYDLQGVKNDGTLGKYTATADTYFEEVK